MRWFFAIAVLAALILIAPELMERDHVPALAGEPPLLGDVDEDGILENQDASSIIEAVVDGGTADLPDHADVNLDGVIDIIDAALISQTVSGVIQSLPPGPIGTPPPRNTASIEIESAEIRPNEWRVLELRALNIDAPGLGAWVIEINYEAGVGDVTGCYTGFGMGGRCNIDEDGGIRLAGATTTMVSQTGDRKLASFRFTCQEAEAITDLTVNVLVFSDHTPGAPQPIDTSITNGTVTCSESALPKPTPTFIQKATPVFEPKISVEHVEAEAGQPFSVALQSWFGSVEISGFSLDVEYPPDLVEFLSCVTLPGFSCVEETPGTVSFDGMAGAAMTGALLLGGITFQASDYNCATFLTVSGEIFFERTGRFDVQTGRLNNGRVVIEGGPDEASGDVNCDGRIDAVDAALVLQQAAGLSVLIYWQNVDVNGDGARDATDALLILQKSAGLL